MTPPGESRRRAIERVLGLGAEAASHALSRWLGEPIRLVPGGVEEVELEAAAGALGPPDALVAACAMGMVGPLAGSLLLCFGDRAGLALADILLRRPVGTAAEWGELERSAALETANIVGCAYLNALADRLPAGAGGLTPTPPAFLHEFAGSLLEFALMGQAAELDRVLLARATFEAADGAGLDWTLLFAPDAPSLAALADALTDAADPT